MWRLRMPIDFCCIGHSNTANGGSVGYAVFPEWWATLGEVPNQTK